eukprot:jgi/Psemu1/291530/fgenesh1_pg.727_\
MKDVLLEEVFRLLEEAKRLEATRCHRIEAATKYYEGCYAMRQIIASGALSSKKTSSLEKDSATSTVSSACKRLLEGKIEHYIKVARRLYFDDRSIHEEIQPESQSLWQEQQEKKQEQKPPTWIMIELLDDTISVMTMPTTATSRIPQTNASRYVRIESPLPRAQKVTRHVRIESPLPRTQKVTAKYTGPRPRPVAPPSQRPRPVAPPSQRHRINLPRVALAASERKIQLHINLAHSKLSQALDLDEKHLEHSRRQPLNPWPLLHKNVTHLSSREHSHRDAAIQAYVEASELYLGAIRMAQTQQSRLPSPSPSLSSFSSSSGGVVRTLTASVHSGLPKLKSLLASILDRVEALKHEEEPSRKGSGGGRRVSPTAVIW